ncbi:MAG: hypothetical protein ACFFDT_32820 [Candidatus Hodarchaeota archaeon]
MLKRFHRKRRKKSTLSTFIEKKRDFKRDAKRWISIGRGQVFVGQVEEAIDTYNHVLKEDPSNEVVRFLKQ